MGLSVVGAFNAEAALAVFIERNSLKENFFRARKLIVKSAQCLSYWIR